MKPARLTNHASPPANAVHPENMMIEPYSDPYAEMAAPCIDLLSSTNVSLSGPEMIEPTPRPIASRPKTTLASVLSCFCCSSLMTPPQLVEYAAAVKPYSRLKTKSGAIDVVKPNATNTAMHERRPCPSKTNVTSNRSTRAPTPMQPKIPVKLTQRIVNDPNVRPSPKLSAMVGR